MGQAEGETAQGRVSIQRNTDLLEESIEGNVTRWRIAFLDVDLEFDRMLIVGIPDAPIARPLFSASRRPFVGDSEAAGEPLPGEGIAIELVGTLLTEQGAAALLQAQGQNARWLHAGDTIAGWQVETIRRDQVSLQLDGEAKTLELRADLDQPAQPPKKVERRLAQATAQPADRAQAQEMRAPDQLKGGDAQRVLAEVKRRLEAAIEPRTD